MHPLFTCFFLYNMAAARGFICWFGGDCYRTVGVRDAKFDVEIIHELPCTFYVKHCNSDSYRDDAETFVLFPEFITHFVHKL
jgi:hypothetical protein